MRLSLSNAPAKGPSIASPSPLARRKLDRIADACEGHQTLKLVKTVAAAPEDLKREVELGAPKLTEHRHAGPAIAEPPRVTASSGRFA
jgi:hypothetical protein